MNLSTEVGDYKYKVGDFLSDSYACTVGALEASVIRTLNTLSK